ncbi:uncharacterized protein LOC122576054 [Bombus pyrosoma]|uniref:uncharacterized protein LOC122576054 n=1 Tax=Bombus pyrosoma TaxID=396416 RepID=UPI001CB93BAA|nr:uncharacterized protein LOC122576054 [Bombus pyrosoma]
MSEIQFASINQYPKYNRRDNEERNGLKPAQTVARNSSEYSSTQPVSGRGSNSRKIRGKERRGERGRENVQTANSTANKRPDNVAKRTYQWCTQCCGKKKAKIVRARKSKSNFFKRLKEKCKKRKRKKKRTSFSEERSVSPIRYEERRVSPVQHEGVIRETSREEKDERFDDSKGAKEIRKRKKKKKMKDVSEPPVRMFQTDQEEKVINNHASELGIDFTKSCCYLCAQNTMAIAAAMSKMGKFHMSIQASTKETLTSDKSCSPTMHVRTVQSSVKVKMRDMGTLHPDKKKSKRSRPKLKLNKRLNILPRLKFPPYPKVRTVACGTDRSMKRNNIPQCRTKRGANCVTDANPT